MKHVVNVVSENDWLKAYKDRDDMNSFVKDCLCDGVEIVRGGEDTTDIYCPENVVGVHLLFYPNWVDFWENNVPMLEKHFGKREIWEQYYMSKNRGDYLKMFQADMDYAEKMGAEYAVFHVSDVSNEEIFTYEWEHSSEQVIRDAAEMVNALTKGRDYHFKLLFENLFTPGMMMLNPKETELMLSLVNYENKGILLDTGHLMCAAQNIMSEEQGIDFVLDTVKKHGDTAKYIKALHLHKSVSGSEIKKIKNNTVVPEEDFYDRFAQSYAMILNVDQHRPFENPRVKEILELVKPEYVTHEVTAKDRDEKLRNVLTQMKALGRI